MFKPENSLHLAHSITQIQEIYHDHPCMIRVNALKDRLKQERLQDKEFYRSLELQKNPC